MPVFRDQHCDGVRFTVRPNCALSWRATKWLFAFFTLCLGAVTAYFAALGAWLVLPFAGLELLVLGIGLYLSSLAGHRREVVQVDGLVLRVLRGGRRLQEVAVFPRQWTRIQLTRDPRGWYPSRLLLIGGGCRIEIAACLVEADREALAAELGLHVGSEEGASGSSDRPPGLSLAEPPAAGIPWPGTDVPAHATLTFPFGGRNKTRCAEGAFLQR